LRTLPSRQQAGAAVADWRKFGAATYRPFQLLAVAQGFIGALSGPAIVIPLLLALGAHPALATLLAVLPVLGTMAQRLVPRALDRTDGNLRGLVSLLAAIGEPRGLLMAGIVALAAAGVLSSGAAIILVAVAMGLLGSLAAVGAGLLGSWYQIILPDPERRLVGPRLAGIALGIGSVVLLPLSLVIDGLIEGIGLWAYVVPLGLGGTAGLVAAVAVRRLPSPGRVRVPRRAGWRAEDDGRLVRLARVITLASLAGGLSPFLAVYAIAVLGTGPGFAIGLSAVSSATLVLASLVVSSQLVRGSASRLLRGSMMLRGFALLLGLAAHPANPVAPLVLILIAVMLAAGDTAGQLSANERLFRLATGPSVIAFQSHFVVRNVLAYSGGLLVGSAIMLLGGYAAFAILFGAAGITRLAGARATEVSPRGGTATSAVTTIEAPGR
jgi:hypothetical protein